jgi:hypothetical protein
MDGVNGTMIQNQKPIIVPYSFAIQVQPQAQTEMEGEVKTTTIVSVSTNKILQRMRRVNKFTYCLLLVSKNII